MPDQPGFQGTMTLLDRQTGQGMVIGLWTTAAELHASMGIHQQLMDRAVEAGVFTAPPTITIYEVTAKTDPQ